MDSNNFKLPSLDSKVKFVSNRPKPESEIQPSEERKEGPKSPLVPKSNPKTLLSIPCPYTEPLWSSAPDEGGGQYSIEMLKNGQIIETVSGLEQQPYWLIGKLTNNHIVMAHPTVSRFHAVLQYRPKVEPKIKLDDNEHETAAPEIQSGWYLYDLSSTHGSFVNKQRIPAKTYVRVRVGYMITIGGSTRRLILQGPDADADPESDLSITEMKEEKRKRAEALVEASKQEELRKEAEGVSWGMTEDADEETDLSINPYASTNNEELYLQDPKKTLRGYFEREGLDLDYKVEELAVASFVCKIELPICDANGRTLIAEVSHKGKKKDCVLQAAMEACRILDRHGVLRQSHHESRKRKVEHTDSDGDDEFFDRTGEVERKRIDKEGQQTQTFSYGELVEQESSLLQKLSETESKIDKYQQLEKQRKDNDLAEDDLDDFMSKMSSDKFDKTDIRRLKVEAINIRADHAKLLRLINLARPTDIPALVTQTNSNPAVVDTNESNAKKKLVLPLFGKLGKFKFSSTASTSKRVVPAKDFLNLEDGQQTEEMEETESGNTKLNHINVKSAEVDMINNAECKPPIFADDKSLEENGSNISNDSISSMPSQTTLHQQTKADTADSAINDTNTEQTKKKRNRQRQRNERFRENVAYDEISELVSSEKYSTWVPPENQSGDGSTTLNDKYGY